MLTHLKIRNFQPHRDLSLALEPVTVIVGPSDVGKTAVIRALLWAMTNDAAGDFITQGETNAKVELTVDGRVVTRKKGPKTNYYSLDGDVPRDAVGSSVPEDVAALLNVAEVNFQGQLDSHYWLSATPGEVSKQLNRVVELGVIDDTVAACASEVRAAQAKKKLLEERLASAKARRSDLRWVEEAAADLAGVRDARRRADDLRDRAAKLARRVAAVNAAHADRTLAAVAVVDGREALAACGRVADLRSTADALRSHLAKMSAAKEEATRCRADLEDKKALLAEEKTCPLCSQRLPTAS